MDEKMQENLNFLRCRIEHLEEEERKLWILRATGDDPDWEESSRQWEEPGIGIPNKIVENWILKNPPMTRPGFCEMNNDIKIVNTAMKMKDHPMGQVLIKAFELCLKKNKDYATQADIFSNFRESKERGVEWSAGVATRLGDKWKRFKKGVRTGWDMDVKDEGMEDTILDIINYASIYYCLYLEERKAKATRAPQEGSEGDRSPDGL